jgi:cyclase
VGEDYHVYRNTGDPSKTSGAGRNTLEWLREAESRGAGEIVLNCMNQDGVRCGYDCAQLSAARAITTIPLVASGGAGTMQHFADVFTRADVDGALAASVFHSAAIGIPSLKTYLLHAGIDVRPPPALVQR